MSLTEIVHGSLDFMYICLDWPRPEYRMINRPPSIDSRIAFVRRLQIYSGFCVG